MCVCAVLLCVCCCVLQKRGETVSQRGQLTPEQKQRRVVLKRVNLDKGGVR